MNSGNVILGVVGVVLAGFVIILSDATAPNPASRAVQGAELRTAITSGKPVLLEFYADWCGPCKMVGPMVEELAHELQGEAKVIRLNVDEHRDLARQYGVRGIPTFITLKHGKETARKTGAIDKTAMRSMLGI